MKSKHYIMLFLLCSVSVCQAQMTDIQAFTDSIKKVFEQTNETKRFNVLSQAFIYAESHGTKTQIIEYAQIIFDKCFEEGTLLNRSDLYYFLALAHGQDNNNLEKALQCFDKAHQMLEKEYPCEAIHQRIKMASLLTHTNYKQYGKAEKMYLEAFREAQEKNCPEKMVEALSALGEDVYDRQNKFADGIHYKLKAAYLADSFQVGKKIIADVFDRTGLSHYRVNNYQKAILFWKKASKIYEDSAIRDRALVRLYSNTGLAYRRQRIYDEARIFFEKAIKEATHQGDSMWIGVATGNVGDIYWETGRYAEALPYLYTDLYFCKKYNEHDNVVNTLIYIGKCHKELKNYDLASRAYDSALLMFANKRTYTSERNLRNSLFVDYHVLDGRADIAFAKGDLQNAFIWKKQASILKDSINRLEQTEQLLRIQAEYDQAEHESENKELKYQNELQKAELKIRFWINLAILIVLFGSISATIWLYVMYQNKKKINDKLRKTNGQLEETMNELKQTHAQLLQSEKMASLGVLTAGIAHEINNPINFVYAGIQTLSEALESVWEIIDYYEKLEQNPTDRQLLMYLQKIKKDLVFTELKEDIFGIVRDMEMGANRTVEIVKGLKTFSRLDENATKKINLHDNIKATLIILNNQIKHRIEIVTDYDPELPQVECRIGQINQVLMNILMNAVQAIPEEGKITIRTRTENEGIKLSIGDTGVGMSEEVKKRIFEPFFTTKEVGKGTGLGLSISIGIIEKHLGKISIESEVGKGTNFHIWLPLQQPQAN